MLRYGIAATLLLCVAYVPLSCEQADLRIGSKKFTESVILGEVVAHLARDAGAEPLHFREIGGTTLVYKALVSGDIDIYPEYTGTLRREIFADRKIDDDEALEEVLREDGLVMSRPLGFNNTYALGMKRQRAEALGIEKISDLAARPDLRLGFGHEFVDRDDGWPSLRQAYDLGDRDVKVLDHDLAYRELSSGAIDVMDVYATDAKIQVHDIVLLEDDREFFTRYDAVLVHRADLPTRFPEVATALDRLDGALDVDQMTRMNLAAELDQEDGTRLSESQIAAEFLEQQMAIRPHVEPETVYTRLRKHTIEHVDLVRKSLVPAILVAIPLGIVAARYRLTGTIILVIIGIVQTVPALALLVILMKPVSLLGMSSLGTGSMNAVVALFLYSLLPIVRNTFAGLDNIARGAHESAQALGLPPLARLRLVELPLAAPTILAGIKTAAVMNVGFATLGALVGAGGYGLPILTGIRLSDDALIMQGAFAAAALALLVQFSFWLIERMVVSPGLRLRAS
ncbi:MAG: ABC transporter permease subunit [Planctomycetota bacterium]|nr:MAG: ABC transporter permease subunit [Planctomycetota bacterium]